MASGGLLSTDRGRKLGDGVSPHELFGKFLAFAKALEEGRGSQAPANDQLSNSVGDVNKAADKFNIWRFFQENCRVKLSIKHRPTPSNTRTRRLNDCLDKVNNVLTPAGKTGRNARRFQSVPISDLPIRRTAVTFPTLGVN